MLHMTVQEYDDGSTVRLSGGLAEEYVAEARQLCFSAKAPLLIDATELQDAGADGLTLLADLITEGAQIDGLSRYLTMRIRTLQARGKQ